MEIIDKNSMLLLLWGIGEIVREENTKTVKTLSKRMEYVEKHVEILQQEVHSMNSIVEIHTMKSEKGVRQSVVETKIAYFNFLYDRSLQLHITEKCVIGRMSKLIFDN